MKKTVLIFFCLLFIPFCTSAEETYDMVYPFQDGYARVVEELKWGLLDENQHLAVDFEWDYIGELSESRRMVKKGEQYGFLDEKHKTVIKPAFHQVSNFSEGFSAVKNEEGKWGYIDALGTTVIPFIYDEANDFSCGLALVKSEGLYGYVDHDNRLVIPAVYEEAYPFYHERACVRVGDAYGYLNPMGELVIPALYELAFDFGSYGAVVKQGGYGLIDVQGNTLIATTWEQLSPQIADGYLKGKKNGSWMFLNTQGKALSQGYSYLGDFSEGLCSVKTDEGYGYIDDSFSLVIPAEWESAGDFSGGYAVVSREGQYGYIDKTGRPVTEIKYADAVRVSAAWGAVSEPEVGYYFLKPSEHIMSPTAGETENFETDYEGRHLLLKIDHNLMETERELIELDAAPSLYEGYTMLPIRQVVEAIGGIVEWEPETHKISLVYESHSVVMHLGESGAFVDGRFTLLEAPPILKNDRTLVPLRFATESLGCDVKWFPDSREILITY